VLKFFVFISRSETTHIASFLFFDRGLIQCSPKSQNLPPSSHYASPDNHLVMRSRYNCRPFVFIVVWYIARQADRNGETAKHSHNCITVLSHFRAPYCTNLRQYSKRLKRCAWQCTHTKLTIFASNFCARKLCRPITLQPVAILEWKKWRATAGPRKMWGAT